MIAAAALLFAVGVPCDVSGVLRAIETSSLPPRVARNVAAKVRWAETACRDAWLVPVKAQDELRVARTWASADKSVTRAIDGAIYDIDHAADAPARLTIRVERDSYFFTIDGIVLESRYGSLTVPLRAGKHEISVRTSDLREASTTVTLAEGEQRAIELTPVKPPRERFFLHLHQQPKICASVHYAKDGVGVRVATLDGVAIETRGTYDVTDLFTATGATLCADAAALHDIVGDSVRYTIRVRGRTANDERVDVSADVKHGKTIVVRGTVPESIRRVISAFDGQSIAVDGGRFELKTMEGPVDLWALEDRDRWVYSHRAELHCDAEVRLTPDKLELVRGGCPGGARFPQEAGDWLEEVWFVTFEKKGDALVPVSRYRGQAKPPEAHNEEWMKQGGFKLRFYAANGVLVYRAVTWIGEWQSEGHVVPMTQTSVTVPLAARYVEVDGGPRIELK